MEIGTWKYSGDILLLVETFFFSPDFRGGVHLFKSSYPIGPVPSFCRVKPLRTDGVHCRESTGSGSVVLKVVPVTGVAFAGHHGPINVHLSFPTHTIGMKRVY